MADLKEAESTQAPTEVPATGETPVKKKAPRSKPATARPKRSPRKAISDPAPAAAASSAPVRRRTYSEKERVQMLGQIDKTVGRGESIKRAVKQAGISEQTYYQWKKSKAPLPTNSDLKDLLALEEENLRLKKLLAERLRKENAELKQKLGLG